MKMKNYAPLRNFIKVLMVILGVAAFESSATAGITSWTGLSGSSTSWTDSSNWNGGVPVSTGTADFVSGSGTVGFTTGTVTGILFDGSAGNYTIGSAIGTGTLTMASGGTLLTASTTYTNTTGTETFNTAINLLGNATVQSGTFAANQMIFKGGISTSATSTLTLNCGNLSASGTAIVINGSLNDGTGRLSLLIQRVQATTSGAVVLNGSNNFSGGIALGAAGVLQVASGNSLGTANASGTLINMNSINTGYGGTLRYMGTGDNLVGAIVTTGTTSNTVTIDQSGASGLLDVLGNFYVLTAPAACTRILQLQGSTSGTGQYAGVISTGSSGAIVSLTKAGTGTWILSGSNSYTGATSGSAGVLNLQNNNALGTGTATLTSGAALQLQSGSGISVGNVLKLAGTGISADGALRSVSGSNTYAGVVTLTAASRINADAGTLYLTTGTVTGAFGLTIGGLGNTVISSIIGTGTGTLSKDGLGSLILTNSNIYTGSTSISAGVLNIQNNNALGTGTANVSGTSTLQLQNNLVVANALRLSGSGFNGGGALENLSGSTTCSGLVTLTGTARINADAGTTLLLTNAGTITGANFDLLVGGSGNTLIKSIIGTTTGDLTKDGSGSLTLTGISTYTGTTTISNGTLQIGNGLSGSDGSISTSVLVVNNAALIYALAGASTYGNVISGTGTLAMTGSGALTLTGTNTYTGSTTISSGTLQIGNGSVGKDGDIATSSGILNNGNLVYNLSSSATRIYSNSITGGGALTKLGAGSLTLTGLNNYIGGTTITGGTLQIGNGVSGSDGSIESTSGIVNNGALIYSLSSTASRTFSNVISGTGSLTETGSGTLALNGANTFTGNTLITGGTLVLGNNLALQNSVFNTSASANSLTIFSGTSTFGGLIGSGTLGQIITNYNTLSTLTLNNRTGVSSTYSGVITDGAPGMNLVKTGSGTQVLSGSTSYTGATTILSGTLGAGGTNTLSANSGFTLTGTSSLNLNGFMNTIGSLAASSTTTTVSLGAASLTTGNDNTSTTFAGAITGSGSLTKIGTGMFTLTGNNSYTGRTTITGGTLQVGDGSLGNDSLISSTSGIVNNGTLVYNLSSTATSTVAIGISGSGALTNSGSGTLVLAAINTFTGVTTINSGTLQIGTGVSGSDGFIGNSSGIVNNAALVYNNYSLSGTYGNVISGTGSLTLNGGGSLTLNGTNTFSGVTRVNNGTLTLGNNLALQNSVLDMDSAYQSVYLNGDSALTLGGLTGSGDLYNFSVNNYANLNDLILNPQGGVSVTYSGGISDGDLGPVNLHKTGAGTQILSGNSTYTGSTLVNAGSLVVSGSLGTTGSVTIDAGADLAVNGFIGGGLIGQYPGSINHPSVNVSGTLRGTGSVYGAVTAQSTATISAGLNGAGILTLDSLILKNGATLGLNLSCSGTDSGGVAGTNWGQIAVTNSLDVTSLTTHIVIALNTFNGGAAGALSSFDPNVSHTWLSVITFGSITGPLDSFYTIDSSGFLNAHPGTFSLVADGNSYDLKYLPVPEPNSLMILLSASVLMLMFQRVRRPKQEV